ncbi:peptidoglycan transpeptidase precursor, ErfK-YbiS-YhnG family [Streptoalloteichus tenebrarius]|uniref:Peptidoglycan transpeptidase, ErfK-YbiS-YhnG family n=1 Tax=Streptoalloteichus tenebrarius (strain ATCC 17920 / DSM 40477 / JCM 4838 / CBS 697.72 / NBRC 16177 / NCIMB 11028 / NRRL B-12390 / A12253. 1 / ISP 5477) TaxID=1933 RepID=A0ABT1I3V4_STRSD|nr:peptidoglycan transpeptidase precursor, ErfK-YbiS-YhnG family [Streptoalloteichus tenebrarius]
MCHREVGKVTSAVVMVVLVALAACTGQDVPPPTSSAPPPVSIAFDPGDGAANVPPLQPVRVTASNGRLVDVVMTNEEGRQVAGQLAPDGGGWAAAEPLGYGRTYTLTATGEGRDNRPVTSKATFTTVKPAAMLTVATDPAEGEVVGVGQPIVLVFDGPVANKDVAEQSVRITTTPAVDGAFHWFDDQQLHWRPREFWPVGTQVSVDARVYGRDFGNGAYGAEDRRTNFVVGNAFVATADGATHQMTVTINGELVNAMPISMGSPDFPSNNGVHVVTERHSQFLMDSTTYGLPLEQGGYRMLVDWATRISNGGEFVHSAPWSVGDQGRRNVSHGCINLAPGYAKWFHDTVKKGDVVIVTNSGGPALQWWDGYGDWQVPWETWVLGGRR